jgi:hypothetical protein
VATAGAAGEAEGRRGGALADGRRRPAYVWDASQTDGEPLPVPPAPTLLEGEAPSGLWEGLAGQIRGAGFEVLRVPHEGMISGANGMTDYEARTVAVRENMDPAAQVKTLAHELAHVLMHDPDDEEARQHRGIREVEAESVALMIGAAHGMDTAGYTIPYVSTWAARVDGQEPAQVVQATGERVRKTALAILDQLDTLQVGDGTPPGLERDTPSPRTSRAAARLRWRRSSACCAGAGAGGAGAVMPEPFDVLAALIRVDGSPTSGAGGAEPRGGACPCSRASPRGSVR